MKSNGNIQFITPNIWTNISGAAQKQRFVHRQMLTKALGIAAMPKHFVLPVFNIWPNESNTLHLNTWKQKKVWQIVVVYVRKGPAQSSYDAVGVLPKESGSYVTEVFNQT